MGAGELPYTLPRVPARALADSCLCLAPGSVDEAEDPQAEKGALATSAAQRVCRYVREVRPRAVVRRVHRHAALRDVHGGSAPLVRWTSASDVQLGKPLDSEKLQGKAPVAGVTIY